MGILFLDCVDTVLQYCSCFRIVIGDVNLRREVTRKSLEYGVSRFGVVHLNEQGPCYGSVGLRLFVGASSTIARIAKVGHD